MATQQKMDAATIYIPTSLDNAIEHLSREYPDFVEEIKRTGQENDFTGRYHSSFGRWMRNNWGLWSGEGELKSWFEKNLGLAHADDMSGIILTCWYRDVRGIPRDVAGQVAIYLAHWEKEGMAP